jgi:molecular chaperone IbpA
MTQYTIPRSWTIGFDSIFDRLESTQSNNSTYPPHNVVKHTDTSFEIALAVAGFKDKDLDVTLEKSILTIEGDNVSLNGDKEYIHKGIATRKFKKQFDLAEHIRVEHVSITDGILSVYLTKEVPEELQPKKFTILQAAPADPEFLTE